MATLIRVKENNPQAVKFATQNNIYVERWYKADYSDGTNFFFDDGGVMQDIPVQYVETKQATATESRDFNNNKLLFG